MREAFNKLKLETLRAKVEISIDGIRQQRARAIEARNSVQRLLQLSTNVMDRNTDTWALLGGPVNSLLATSDEELRRMGIAPETIAEVRVLWRHQKNLNSQAEAAWKELQPQVTLLHRLEEFAEKGRTA